MPIQVKVVSALKDSEVVDITKEFAGDLIDVFTIFQSLVLETIEANEGKPIDILEQELADLI